MLINKTPIKGTIQVVPRVFDCVSPINDLWSTYLLTRLMNDRLFGYELLPCTTSKVESR